MGVLSCSRRCCSNIMCDTYVDDIGYICYECQDSFKNYLKDKNLRPKTESEIRKFLKEFMETERIVNYPDREVSIEDFFKKNTESW